MRPATAAEIQSAVSLLEKTPQLLETLLGDLPRNSCTGSPQRTAGPYPKCWPIFPPSKGSMPSVFAGWFLKTGLVTTWGICAKSKNFTARMRFTRIPVPL